MNYFRKKNIEILWITDKDLIDKEKTSKSKTLFPSADVWAPWPLLQRLTWARCSGSISVSPLTDSSENLLSGSVSVSWCYFTAASISGAFLGSVLRVFEWLRLLHTSATSTELEQQTPLFSPPCLKSVMISTDNYIYLHINVIDTCLCRFLKPLHEPSAADLVTNNPQYLDPPSEVT